MEKPLSRLRYQERIIIETLLIEKKSISDIARRIGRNRSSVYREVKKWVIRPTDVYKAELAQFCAKEDYLNKRNLDKINTHQRLKDFVYAQLANRLSPEQIAGRLRELYPNDLVMSISYEAIYQHIYKKRQSKLGRELIALLPYSHSRRRNKRRTPKRKNRIKDAVSIECRPQHVQLRREVGHWESDLVIGLGQKSAIATVVERKTRFTYIIPIRNRTSVTVTKAIAKTINQLNKEVRKSMTHDNGPEMANHKWLTDKTGMDIYFAHPYSSWERGTNENTNGLIRRFFPKGTDFSKISEQRIRHAQDNLNNRPRKVLGYKTPNEMMELELANIKYQSYRLN